MQHLIDSVRRSIAETNWYATLCGALTLPDVAAKVDGRPKRDSQKKHRYATWFDDYIGPKYKRFNRWTSTLDVFLSGDDCYALRCAFLHEAEFDITGQSAQLVLERFEFTAPIAPGSSMHLNKSRGTVLQLQVDVFGEDICLATEEWLAKRGNDPAVAQAISSLPKINFSGIFNG
jgi:hypothetical protein